MIFLGCDHAGFDLKQEIKTWLIKHGLDFIDLSPILIESDDYPDIAKLIAENLVNTNDLAIAICGTGQGICMALNRYTNIRAGSSINPKIIKLTRSHNHSNVLCLPGRFIKPDRALYLIKIFVNTLEDQDNRHIRRLSKLS
jgi:ribose 5-phosphate isomerase B